MPQVKEAGPKDSGVKEAGPKDQRTKGPKDQRTKGPKGVVVERLNTGLYLTHTTSMAQHPSQGGLPTTLNSSVE